MFSKLKTGKREYDYTMIIAKRSKPSILVYDFQIMQSQPATSCFPIHTVPDEKERTALAGIAGSHH